ncbi:hypothetical protein PIB30_065946 [Stylosanthes scabra]|uniref:Uncharacterized protein n=1 Tax=Stylosanthes scabra TaxID=79078 RepID=A0ABU6YMX6_9FABA|nr:hypothetical protein [Stylosanthes scabra]
MVKTKGAPRKVPNGQKRRRCLHCRSTKHNIRTCPIFSKKKDSIDREEESCQPEFEDDLTVEESETNDIVGTQESTPKPKGRTPKEFLSKLKATPKNGLIGKKSTRHKTKEISSSEATLKGKTDTQGIEVSKVETTTSNLESSKYPVHHIPWIYPYQPNNGAMLTPMHPFYSGLPFSHHIHNIGTTSYP